MEMRSVSPQVLLFGVALAFAGCNASLPSAPSAGFAQASPQYAPTRSAVGAATTDLFSYGGGPVLLEPKAYLILWGYKRYGDPDGVAKVLRAYVSAVGGSAHDGIYTQYYEIVDGKKKYIENPKNQDGGVWDDEKHAVPSEPTDKQVAQEALRGVAKFGYDPNGSYIVATPHDHSTSGFGVQWCAYHNVTYHGSSYVSYTNLPYIPDAGANCGADFLAPPKDESRTDEGVTIIEGAMYGDSVTDPVVGTGWSNAYDKEISDPCVWLNVENDRFGKKSYATQPMYSIVNMACVQSD